MTWPLLKAVVDAADDGTAAVRCPGPGKVRWQRGVGEAVVPGSRLGLIRRDARTYELVLPDGARGRVTEVALADPWTRCEHGQVLGRLGPLAGGDEERAAGGTRNARPAGGFEVRSPTHGTFYHRPSPDAESYVEPGREIERGQVLGLVEVMKCFSPIVFDPPAGVTRGVVREIVAADGSEVMSDETLLAIDLSETA